MVKQTWFYIQTLQYEEDISRLCNYRSSASSVSCVVSYMSSFFSCFNIQCCTYLILFRPQAELHKRVGGVMITFTRNYVLWKITPMRVLGPYLQKNFSVSFSTFATFNSSLTKGSITVYYIPAENEKVACDTIFGGQWLQPLSNFRSHFLLGVWPSGGRRVSFFERF